MATDFHSMADACVDVVVPNTGHVTPQRELAEFVY